MPILLDIDHDQQRTHAVAIGEITLAELRSHLGEEGEQSGLGYRELIDASQATATFNTEDARQIVQILRNLGLKGALGPTAVIVSNDLTYGMFRMLEIILGDVCEVRPFRVSERKEAENWLETARITKAKHSDESVQTKS